MQARPGVDINSSAPPRCRGREWVENNIMHIIEYGFTIKWDNIIYFAILCSECYNIRSSSLLSWT